MTAAVRGARELHDTLTAAAKQIQQLDSAAQAAAGIIVPAAAGRAPRRTGTLAASGRPSVVDGRAVVSYPVAHAGPIHWGWRARGIPARPFALEAARATETTWLRAYEEAVQAVLDTIHGA